MRARLIRALGLTALLTGLAACGHVDNQAVPYGKAVEASLCKDMTYAGFPLFMPKPQKNNYFVCHQAYALEFNVKSKTPLWVVERLTAAEQQAPVKAKRFIDLRPDPLISVGDRSQLSHFTKTGYDAGQMAPTADMEYADGPMSQSFYYSNMVPQDRSNNRGIWAVLEQNVRNWAVARGQVYVITGPIFANGTPKGWVGQYSTAAHYYSTPTAEEIRRQQIAVPTHLYKIVVDPARQEAIAFIVPNEPVPVAALPQYATTVATVEQATSLQFFSLLPPAQAAALKTNVTASHWPMTLGLTPEQIKANTTSFLQ